MYSKKMSGLWGCLGDAELRAYPVWQTKTATESRRVKCYILTH